MSSPRQGLTRNILLLILGLSAIAFLWEIGSRDLWGADEMRYASTARDMAEGGSWISPKYNGHPDGEKPPLFYWLAALVGSFQETPDELGVLLASALGGFLSLIFAFLLGELLFGRKTALYAICILATAPGFIWQGRNGQMDSLFAACVLASVYYMFRFLESNRKADLAWGWAWCGVGWLAKSPLIVLLVQGAIFFRLWMRGELRKRWASMEPWWCVLITLAIVVPWYVALYMVEDWALVKWVLWDQNFTRYTNFTWGGTDPRYFYYKFLPKFLPWTFALLVAAWLALRGRSRQITEKRFLLLWFVSFLVFFILGSSRREVYLLPLYPAAAYLVASLWTEPQVPGNPQVSRRPLLFTHALFTWIISIGFLGFAFYVIFTDFFPEKKQFRYWDALPGITLTAAALFLGGWWSTFLLRAKKTHRAFVTWIGFLLLAELAIFGLVIPEVNPQRSKRAIIRKLVEPVPEGTPIWTYRFERPWVVYYSPQRLAGYVGDPKELAEKLEAGDYALVDDYHLEQFKKDVGTDPEILRSMPRRHPVHLVRKRP